jgi:prevent-host-death family protein
MAEVGIRELRDHLSRYLERVQAGEELTVTDRGRPVALLIPVSEPRAFDRLVTDGVIEPAAPRRRDRPARRVSVTASVSELVAEQRR